MQQKVTRKVWHDVVELRPELKRGELAMSTFAADLQDVAMDTGRDLYRDASPFFSFTYPTFNLRELAKQAGQVTIHLAPEPAGSRSESRAASPVSAVPLAQVHERSPRNWRAESYPNLTEMAELHEQLGEIRKLAVDQDLEVYVRLEVYGKDDQPVPLEIVEQINALLRTVSERFKLQQWERG